MSAENAGGAPAPEPASALAKLRAQKPTPIEFTSSQAYIIMGHGKDSDRMIKVPDNCMVIVKYRPGELGHALNVLPLWNTVGAPENVEIYRDPLHHIPEVINQLGDVLIYKPGDMCPNFTYSFVWNGNNFFTDEIASHWAVSYTHLTLPTKA